MLTITCSSRYIERAGHAHFSNFVARPEAWEVAPTQECPVSSISVSMFMHTAYYGMLCVPHQLMQDTAGLQLTEFALSRTM